ncbi:MAG: 1-acyl-sn-glycerol-3-phosphate acyltransferase [Planctomycetota bacterium]
MSGSDKLVRLQSVRRSAFWWTVSRFLVLVFSKVWFRIRCEGVDKLPKEGGVLLVANHSSYLDPGMVGITATRWVGFLAQAGLASLAPCRWWLSQVGVTLIDRDAPSKQAMRLISDCLKAGEVVGLFPEGTRSKDGSVDVFKGGVEFLVRRTKTTVVPIGIDGSHRAYPRGAWFPRPRKIVVRYGEPWTAEQVLAEGGVEALRRKVAELAGRPLTESAKEPPQADGSAADPSKNPIKVPADAGHPPNSPAQECPPEASGGHPSKGSATDLVDPSSSSSASAGGGA